MGGTDPSTFDRLLHQVAQDHGDRVAVVGPAGDRLTYAQLVDEAALVAGGLRALGLERGDTIAAWYPNRPEWVLLLAAAARLGVGVLALNTRFRRVELSHLLSVGRCRWVLAASDFLGIDAAAVLREVAEDHAIRALVVGEVAGFDGLDPVGWSELATAQPAPAVSEPGDLLAAFTTSGTTGFPKLAGHDHAGTLHHAAAVAHAFDVAPGTLTLVPLPLCGVFGFTPTVAALSCGAGVALHETFDPGRCARAVSTGDVTHLHGSDDMLNAILAHPDLDPERSRWSTGVFADFTGTGRLAVARADELSEGRLRLSGVYGSSEGFALMCRWPAEAPATVRSVNGGYPISPRLQVRAVDPDSGDVLVPGQPGELQFRGPNMIDGYLNDEAATARAFTADGWFRSGDLGLVQADGAFVYQARLGDSLRLRGFLVDPAEIEHHLGQHPMVDVAQVVGVDVEGRGQVAVAFVRAVPGAAPSVEDLRAFCVAGLANYKVPAVLELVPEFPVTDGPNGIKIRKVELRQRAAELLRPAEPT